MECEHKASVAVVQVPKEVTEEEMVCTEKGATTAKSDYSLSETLERNKEVPVGPSIQDRIARFFSTVNGQAEGDKKSNRLTENSEKNFSNLLARWRTREFDEKIADRPLSVWSSCHDIPGEVRRLDSREIEPYSMKRSQSLPKFARINQESAQEHRIDTKLSCCGETETDQQSETGFYCDSSTPHGSDYGPSECAYSFEQEHSVDGVHCTESSDGSIDEEYMETIRNFLDEYFPKWRTEELIWEKPSKNTSIRLRSFGSCDSLVLTRKRFAKKKSQRKRKVSKILRCFTNSIFCCFGRCQTNESPYDIS